MKRLIVLFLLAICSAGIVSAQDVIVKADGMEILSKIVEISDNEIRYRLYDQPGSPLRTIGKSEVFMIVYENGRRESFSAEVLERQQDGERTKSKSSGYKGNYVSLAAGYGMSYSGLGTRFQWRTGGNVGFGMHAGLGFGPGDVMSGMRFSFGLKLFAYRGLYINTQLGAYEDSYITDSGFEDYHMTSALSVLVGGDWISGGKVGFGLNTALGFSHLPDDGETVLAFDLGLIIRF